MKKILLAFMLLAGFAILQSCYYDNPPELLPFDCEDVSYSTHIQPILDKSCGTQECHDGTVEPDLRIEAGWNELRSGGHLNLTIPEESRLYLNVEFIENPMPPGGPQITELNRQLILCWLTEGAFNN